MINRDPYPDPANNDRMTLDVDRNDEVNYGWNVVQWCRDNATSVASFEVIPEGCTVLLKGTPQGELNAMLPAKMKVTFPADVAAPCATARATTADGQIFDSTMWFKEVVK